MGESSFVFFHFSRQCKKEKSSRPNIVVPGIYHRRGNIKKRRAKKKNDRRGNQAARNTHHRRWPFSVLFFKLLRDQFTNHAHHTKLIDKSTATTTRMAIHDHVAIRFLSNLKLSSMQKQGILQSVLKKKIPAGSISESHSS
jgi:hypothetical protein